MITVAQTGASTREAQLGEIRSLAVGLAEAARQSLGRVREARGELPPQGSLVAFVHIPKTAGGTVINMLTAAYSRAGLHDAGNYIVSPDKAVHKLAGRGGRWLEWEREGGRVTAGHVPYAVYRQYLPQGTRYMTFLRDPVDRVVSHYHQHIGKRDEPDPRTYDRKKVLTASMDEAFELQLPMVCNLATRLLCGHPAPLGRLPETALDDAKENLQNFAFVGLQERFEESMVLLQRILGLEMTPFVNRHVSVGRPLLADLDEEERQLILDHNRLDEALYGFGKQLFDRSLRAVQGDGFAGDLERLSAISAEANEEALRSARELLDRELPVGASKPKAELFAAARTAGVPAAALKYVSKVGVKKHGEKLPGAAKPRSEKIWTRTG